MTWDELAAKGIQMFDCGRQIANGKDVYVTEIRVKTFLPDPHSLIAMHVDIPVSIVRGIEFPHVTRSFVDETVCKALITMRDLFLPLVGKSK